jgi:hypothetical protein
MPTLPLFEIPNDRDRSHRVIAPGGYEWWRFDATGGTTRVRIDVFDGDPFSAAYRAAYERYRRRPTRVPPPTPRDSPRARIVVTEASNSPWTNVLAGAPGSLQTAADAARLSIGPLSLRFEDGGASLRLTVAAADFQAELRFLKPAGANLHTRQFDADERSAVDHWISYDVDFDVSGTMKTQEFRGAGRFDHFFGTGPMGIQLQQALKQLGA